MPLVKRMALTGLFALAISACARAQDQSHGGGNAMPGAANLAGAGGAVPGSAHMAGAGNAGPGPAGGNAMPNAAPAGLNAAPAGAAPAGQLTAQQPGQVDPQGTVGKQPCPFDKYSLGPNILVAAVKVPDGRQEIGGWIFGYNWCSNYNRISGGKDICDKSPVEYLHIPLSDKFGDFHDYECYNNVHVTFENCDVDHATGNIDYPSVRARFTSTIDDSNVVYECKPDRELRGCVYVPGKSDVSYTAFINCGITAEP